MQLELFNHKPMPGGTSEFASQDITAAKHHGNKYSAEANKSLTSNKQRLRLLVLSHIKAQGSYGATCDEAAGSLGMLAQSCSARFTELKALDLIKEIGKRKTRSGRNAGVWAVV